MTWRHGSRRSQGLPEPDGESAARRIGLDFGQWRRLFTSSPLWFVKKTVVDPVTGWEIDEIHLENQLWGRRRAAEFLGVGPDRYAQRYPDEGSPRVTIATWLVTGWLDGFWVEAEGRWSTGGTDRTVHMGFVSFAYEQMSDEEMYLLLQSVPRHPRAPELPRPDALKTAIEAIPEDPDSEARAAWRAELQARLGDSE